MELFDQAGFSTFHITEHHFTPLGLAPSPLIFLSAASRITKSIRLAPLVLILPLYNPLRLAAELCMLDHLSKGRLDIGVGRGISPYELAFYNINHLEAQSIYNEAYEVLMMALTRETVDFRGHYFKYFNVPIEMRPYQKPHPPLWYATGSEEGAAWAGKPEPQRRVPRAGAARQGAGRRLQEGPRFQQRKRVAADRERSASPGISISPTPMRLRTSEGQKATRPGSRSTPGFGRNTIRGRRPRSRMCCAAMPAASLPARRDHARGDRAPA